MLDDRHPYAYKTANYGETWTSIAKGLPGDAPCYVVRENPNKKGFLVAGTGTGLFSSTDSGASWKPLEGDFPNAPVWDVKFVKASHDLVVATHGRGLFVLDNITPIEEWTDAIEGKDFHLFSAPPAAMLPDLEPGWLRLGRLLRPESCPRDHGRLLRQDRDQADRGAEEGAAGRGQDRRHGREGGLRRDAVGAGEGRDQPPRLEHALRGAEASCLRQGGAAQRVLRAQPRARRHARDVQDRRDRQGGDADADRDRPARSARAARTWKRSAPRRGRRWTCATA